MEFVTGAILGGMLYDLVKFGVKVSHKVIQEKAKDEQKSWPADEPTTEKIVDRINTLGYHDGENKEQYCQRLADDAELNQLLSTTHQSVVSQDINNLQGIGQNSGTINNPTFNFGAQGNTPAKKS
ncbi:MAG: hypothetical protein ACI8WB_003408 [Phenylobacterium sp.]|jgi:hypothetical protein